MYDFINTTREEKVSNNIGQFPTTLTPDLQNHMQRAAVAQQQKVVEAIALNELPAVMVNSIQMQSLGAMGAKIIVGETPEGIQGLPMKVRASLVLSWDLVGRLIAGLQKADREANSILKRGPDTAA